MLNKKEINLWPSGKVIPPSSKSYGHRALICAALAAIGPHGGQSHILNAVESDDIKATKDALALFAVEMILKKDQYRVRPSEAVLSELMDCGESGSTLRFLLPLAAVLGPDARHKEAPEKLLFTGRGRLMERPLEAYATIFSASGVKFEQNGKFASIEGRLRGGNYTLRGDVSSQFISGLLMALPLAEEDSRLILSTPLQSSPYVDMTLEVMASFGVKADKEANGDFFISGRQTYQAASYTLEADFSQAAFFLAAAALGRPVRTFGLKADSLQGDRAIVDILKKMNAEIQWQDGFLDIKCEKLKAVTVDVGEIPDLVPILSVLASFAEGESHIVNAGRLRIKESDRLHSMAVELKKMGADIVEGDDFLRINGQDFLAGGATVDAHNDHRVAMSLAVASILCQESIYLTGAESVNKSYRNFWKDFERAGR